MNILPNQLTSFIGREQEVAAIRCLLQETRLLSLTGPGGCGKTRLALHAAQSLVNCFADGLYWVELAAVVEPTLLPQTLLSNLAPALMREQPECAPLDLLIDRLRDKEILILLDNCEHLIAACAQLAGLLLRASPSLRILTTTRESLNIDGEAVWLVPSLSLPRQGAEEEAPLSTNLSYSELAQYEAIRLFIERAQACRHTFGLTAENAPAVLRICRRLEGMPLAIELAAARGAILSPAQIASYLDKSFALLEAHGRSPVARHHSLQTVMDWSYRLLSEAEQRLLQRLSVFSGGFTLEAAAYVCAASPNEEPKHYLSPDVGRATQREALDLIASLVNKSLVAVQEVQGLARYRLLESIRQYADEKLEGSHEKGQIRERHLDWCIALAEEIHASLTGPQGGQKAAHLHSEHDNLAAALEWALAQEDTPALVGKSARLVFALTSFWSFLGYAKEGQEWLGRVLAKRHLLSGAMEAHAVIAAGVTAWGVSDFVSALHFLEEGAAIARTLGKEGLYQLYAAVNYLGLVTYYQDDYVRALASFEEGLALILELGLRSHEPFAYSLMGRVKVRQGDYRGASELGEKSLALSYELDNVHSISATLNLLGTVACYQGAFDQATRLLVESLARSRALGIQQDIADTLVIMAAMAIAQGNNPKAKSMLEESLAVARKMGYRQGIAVALGRLGEVACRQQEFERAQQLLCESLNLLNSIGARWHTLHMLEILAFYYLSHEGNRHRSYRAAKILGAVHTARLVLGAPVAPIERPRLEESIRCARSTLGTSHFETAWAEGSKLDLPAAIDWALTELSPMHTPAQRLTIEFSQSDHPAMRIYALGPTEVFRAGALVTNSEWGYAKPRELFFYLLCHPPRTREQIGLVLWPEASPSQLRSRLHVALHRLRQALGDGEWVHFENGRYSINNHLMRWFDVEFFGAKVQEAQSVGSQSIEAQREKNSQSAAIRSLEDALRLYRGDFLEEMEPYEWILAEREALRTRYINALLTLGQLHYTAGHVEAAAENFRRAIATDPYLEVAHRQLMRSLAHLHGKNHALRHYHKLVDLFADELGAAPAAETVALMESLRHPPPT